MKKTIQNLSVVALLLISYQAPAAPGLCGQVHSLKGQTAAVRFIQREELASALIAGQIPAVAIPTAKGPIPAILMNADTAPRLEGLLNQSIGTVVNYQPEYNNDHGMIRLFQVLADMDSPGSRREGELHQTGISWVNLNRYIPYAQGRTRVKVEVVYSLSPTEARTAMAYHLMRRAAIVRVPFTFGGRNRQVGFINQLERSGEHCFIFCTGSGLHGQVLEIQQNFEKYNLGKIEEVVNREDVQKWLKAVETELLKVSPADENSLNATLPLRVGIPESLAAATAQMTPEGRAEFLNWIAAFSISQKYANLTQTLGIQGDTGYNGIQNSRAVAILLYDGTSSPESFTSPDYVAQGKFSTWKHKNAKPLTEAFPNAVVAAEIGKPAPVDQVEAKEFPTPAVPAKKEGILKRLLNFIL